MTRPEEQSQNKILIDGRTWIKTPNPVGSDEEWTSDHMTVFLQYKAWSWIKETTSGRVFGYWATRQGAMRAADAGVTTPPSPVAKEIQVATPNPTKRSVGSVTEPEQYDLVQTEMNDE